VNSKRSILRERTRLRRSQNPQQIDFRRMRKARENRTEYWASRKRVLPQVEEIPEKTKEKAKPKKEKKPELEVIEEEPETETIDEELEEIYSYDDEVDNETYKDEPD
jgi:hypothetical protein